MEVTIYIKFQKYEDEFNMKYNEPIGKIIKKICDIHGLEYKYYGLYINDDFIEPTLPSYPYHYRLIHLYERFLF